MGRRPNHPEDEVKAREQVGLYFLSLDKFGPWANGGPLVSTGGTCLSKAGSESGWNHHCWGVPGGVSQGRRRYQITSNVRHLPLMTVLRQRVRCLEEGRRPGPIFPNTSVNGKVRGGMVDPTSWQKAYQRRYSLRKGSFGFRFPNIDDFYLGSKNILRVCVWFKDLSRKFVQYLTRKRKDNQSYHLEFKLLHFAQKIM